MSNILIVGKGAVVSALSRKLQGCGKIFAAPGNCVKSDLYENIDIRENDLTGLLKFALDNDVELTIAVSPKSLKADIAAFFTENGQNIFAPAKNACSSFLNRIYEKKFLYRIHANCPKFGAFSRSQEIRGYLSEANFPVVISSAEPSELGNDRLVCPTISVAQKFLDDLYNKGETDILVEEYTYGKTFTAYYVTDGYSALPITTVGYEQSEILTDRTGAYAPNYYITPVIEENLQTVANDIISTCERKGCPYVGILGIEGIITGEDNFVVESIKTFLQDYDARAVLNICEDDLYKIFTSCVNGFFSDEYQDIKTNDLHCASVITSSNCGIDDADYIDLSHCVLTVSARTLTRAKKCLQEELRVI